MPGTCFTLAFCLRCVSAFDTNFSSPYLITNNTSTTPVSVNLYDTWYHNYILGASILGLITCCGACWWVWLVQKEMEGRHATCDLAWLGLSIVLRVLYFAIQFLPLVGVFLVDGVSKTRGTLWWIHWVYAAVLFFILPMSTIIDVELGTERGNNLEKHRRVSEMLGMICTIPFLGFRDSLIGKLYGFISQAMYPADVYLDAMTVAVALHVGYIYARQMLVLLVGGVCAQAFVMALAQCLTTVDSKVSVFWTTFLQVLTGRTPETFGSALLQGVLSITRFFTEELWQFALGMHMAITYNAGIPVMVSLAFSLCLAIKHVNVGVLAICESCASPRSFSRTWSYSRQESEETEYSE